MFQLFTKPFSSQNGVIKPPEFEYIQRTYQHQLSNIVDYYHNRVYAVKSQHLLVRLLTINEIPINYDIERYMEVAYTRSPFVAKNFRLTSDINYGDVKPSVFYGDDNNEIILYDETYFDLYEASKDWKNIQAVKVIEHPFSDMGLALPTGIKTSTDTGLVVMSINIPLLMLQYRQFSLEQQIRVNTEEGYLGATHFVHMYVLPNILYSHIELCVVNRLINLFYSAPMGDSLKRHPFHVIDYRDKVDKSLLGIVKRLKKTRMLYFSVLKNIPSFYHEDSQQSLQVIDIAPTKQVWWALLISRLRIIQFIIDIGGESGIRMNMTLINKLHIDLKRLLEENVIKSLLPDELYDDTLYTINALMTLSR